MLAAFVDDGRYAGRRCRDDRKIDIGAGCREGLESRAFLDRFVLRVDREYGSFEARVEQVPIDDATNRVHAITRPEERNTSRREQRCQVMCSHIRVPVSIGVAGLLH